MKITKKKLYLTSINFQLTIKKHSFIPIKYMPDRLQNLTTNHQK